MQEDLDSLWNNLQERLLALAAVSGGRGLAIAFSGGVDSRFLTHAATLLGIKVLALHFCGPQFKREATDAAVLWLRERSKGSIAGQAHQGQTAAQFQAGAARQVYAGVANQAQAIEHEQTTGQERAVGYNLEYRVLEADSLVLDAVRNNAKDRCYHCKKMAFGLLLAEARRLGITILCDGSLASDNAEYRPGRRAMAELGIVSPLADLGFSKAAVRALGTELGLDNAGQSGQPCLLTRFAYGLAASPSLLRQLDAAESAVARVAGALPFRLRLLPTESGQPKPELHLQLAEAELLKRQADGSWAKLVQSLQTVLAAYDFSPAATESPGSPGLSNSFDSLISSSSPDSQGTPCLFGSSGREPIKIVAMPELSGFFDRNIERVK